MVKTPNQPQSTKKKKVFDDFSHAVIWRMNERNITQADLVRLSALSKSTISNMLRNTNNKGKKYRPTPEVVMAVSIGLKLTYDEYLELLYLAYPSMEHIKELLDKRFSIDEANIVLYDKGLPLLGNIKKD